MGLFKILFTTLSLLIISGCSESKNNIEKAQEENQEIETTYAKHFRIFKCKDGYELNILNPNSKKSSKKFFFKSGEQNKIISLTATFNGMVSILDGANELVGISDINYIHAAKIIRKFKKEKLIEYGDESTFSIEKIASSNANLILYSGFGANFPNEAKLEKLNIKMIPIYDWREDHPLGKAEWIKVAGVILGKEKEAIAAFEKVRVAYLNTKKLISTSARRPTVMCGNLIGNVWYMPGGDGYFSTLLNDAGSQYIHEDMPGTISLEFSIEYVLKNNLNTEFWLNPGTDTKTKIERLNPHAKNLNAYNNIYCYSPNMNKFWERSASEPHLVLSDLIHIFHPEIKDISEFHFYEKIK